MVIKIEKEKVFFFYKMIIERTKNEIVIRLLPTIDTEELQELVNYFRYKELTS